MITHLGKVKGNVGVVGDFYSPKLFMSSSELQPERLLESQSEVWVYLTNRINHICWRYQQNFVNRYPSTPNISQENNRRGALNSELVPGTVPVSLTGRTRIEHMSFTMRVRVLSLMCFLKISSRNRYFYRAHELPNNNKDWGYIMSMCFVKIHIGCFIIYGAHEHYR